MLIPGTAGIGPKMPPMFSKGPTIRLSQDIDIKTNYSCKLLIREAFKVEKKSMEFSILCLDPPPESMEKLGWGVQKVKKFLCISGRIRPF